MLYEQIRRNKQKSILFIIGFFLFIQLFGIALGILVSGNWVLGIAITSVTSLFYIIIMISSSETIIMNMNHAKPVTKEEYPVLYNVVEEISLVAGLKVYPKVYIIKEDSPNAFATGLKPEKSAIGVTSSLLEKLNREELEGVIAHEVSHIVSSDCRLSTVTIALISAVMMLSDFIFYRTLDNDAPAILRVVGIVFMMLSPLIAYSIQFGLSRNREYLADANAIKLTRNPVGLKNALIKIDSDTSKVDNIPKSCAAIYITDPLKKNLKNSKKIKKASLFSTHPTIESRVDRLDKM